jgi:hypothetical protein
LIPGNPYALDVSLRLPLSQDATRARLRRSVSESFMPCLMAAARVVVEALDFQCKRQAPPRKGRVDD